MLISHLCLALLSSPGVPLHGLPIQGAPIDPLTCAPEDAVMFASVQQLDALRADGRENAWYRMLRDADFEPTWERLRQTEAWKEVFEANDADVDPLAFMASIHGSITLFVEQPVDGEGAGCLVIDPGPDRAEFDEYLDALLDPDGLDGVVSYETHGDFELMLLEDEETGDDEPIEALVLMDAYGLTFFVAAGNGELALSTARATLDRIQGEGPTLADSELLAEARGSDTAPGRVEVFFNTLAFAEAVKEEDPDLDEDDLALIAALGLEQMTWAHAWLDVGQGEATDFALSFRLPDEGYVREWAGFFMPAPREMASMMPQDSNNIGMAGFDVWGLYQSVWDMVEEVFPDDYEMGRQQLEGASQSLGGVDIEQDLLAQIAGTLGTFSAPVSEAEWLEVSGLMSGYSPGEVPADLLYGNAVLVGLRDAELVSLAIEDLMGFAAMMGLFDPMEIESEDFQGLEIQSLPLPNGATASWCFDDGLFAFSMYPSALRSALRLRGSEEGASVLKNQLLAPHIAANAGASYLNLADSKKAVRLGLESLSMLQSMFGQFGPAGFGGMDNSASPDDFDWDFGSFPIPAGEVADRYLKGTMISTMRVDGNAVKIRFKTR